jgi:gas vesicle protein
MFQILSLILLLGTSYVLGVFFAPAQTDEIAGFIGADGVNEVIRSMKSSADTVSTRLIEFQEASGGVLDTAKDALWQVQDTVSASKQMIETKVDQTKKVVEKVEQTANAVQDLKSSVQDLTSMSGASQSGGTSSGYTTSETSLSGALWNR